MYKWYVLYVICTRIMHSQGHAFFSFLSSEPLGDGQQLDSPSTQLRSMGSEELSTSFSTAGDTGEMETPSHTGQR